MLYKSTCSTELLQVLVLRAFMPQVATYIFVAGILTDTFDEEHHAGVQPCAQFHSQQDVGAASVHACRCTAPPSAGVQLAEQLFLSRR